MRYLKKIASSQVIKDNLVYDSAKSRVNKQILKLLKGEQKNFCAYSEIYLMPTDAVEVEHFDPRLKHSEGDGYWNYYAVIRFMNSKKSNDIEKFQPLLTPHDETVQKRIKFENWQFKAVDPNDLEAENLIAFLGVNLPELYEQRKTHVTNLLYVRQKLSDDEAFWDIVLKDPNHLSFATAVMTAIDIQDQKVLCLITQNISENKTGEE